jgi:glycosyltransferase involved in cell wall biosynthesis
MAAYNAELFIRDSILSIQGQTYPHWELIVVDDGSTDSTVDIVSELARHDTRISCIRQANARQNIARNNGLRHARYPWVAFCDADDLWHPEKLSRQLEHAKDSGAQLVFSSYRVIDDAGRESKVLKRKAQPLQGLSGLRILLDSNPILLSSVMVRKESILQEGGFGEDPALPPAEDYHMWLRLLLAGLRFYRSGEVLVDYRRHSGQATAADAAATRHAIYAIASIKTHEPSWEPLKTLYLKRWYLKLIAAGQASREFDPLILQEYARDVHAGFPVGLLLGLMKLLGKDLAGRLFALYLLQAARRIARFNKQYKAAMLTGVK